MDSTTVSYGYRLIATYESGFVLAEDAADHSPYDPGKNTFHAIVQGRPTEHGHGNLTRLALYPEPDDGRPQHVLGPDVWALPEARPICYRRMERELEIGGDGTLSPAGDAYCVEIVFGYQWLEAGSNRQETMTISPPTG